jgi:hypothetical protein
VTGPCNNTGIWPDAGGCCPVELNATPFYRDTRGCYPIITTVGTLYADSTGCYPNAAGIYLGGNQPCPDAQRCSAECLSA